MALLSIDEVGQRLDERETKHVIVPAPELDCDLKVIAASAYDRNKWMSAVLGDDNKASNKRAIEQQIQALQNYIVGVEEKPLFSIKQLRGLSGELIDALFKAWAEISGLGDTTGESES